MKSIYTFLVLILLSTGVFSQELVYNSPFLSSPFKKKNGLPEKFRAVSLKFGPRFLNPEAGTIITKFTDDSPSQDKFESSTTIKDRYTNFGIHFSFDWRKYAGLNHSIYIDYAYGENAGFLFGYNIGWNIVASENIIIRPALNVAIGSTNFSLGRIENNAGYIAIGLNEYTDPYLNVSLSGDYTVLGPQLDIRYLLAERVHAILNVGGIRISLGASYVWNRD